LFVACPIHRWRADAFSGEVIMPWTKPTFEVVAVTMEVTAYVKKR